MKKYSIISLGCSKNLVDSEVFSYQSKLAGYEFTEDLPDADLIIINTCGFILDAREESIDTILEAIEFKKSGKAKKLIVTGCLVKLHKKEILNSIPEIDQVVDLKDFTHFADLLQVHTEIDRELLTPSHYAYLRISDGCNNHCAYCIIPSIRGDLQSVPIEELVLEAKNLSEHGVKELIITAQDTAAYGTDIYGKPKIIELLRELHQIEKIEWIRILYLHPAHLTKKLIDTMATLAKICNYFEIPLQHIDDDILASMNRKISKHEIVKQINYIRKKLPNAVIRTTFITGYPGETEEKFQTLVEFIKAVKFERLGVFSYSKEDNSKAASLKGQIPSAIAEKRKDEIMQVQQEISEDFLAKFVGKEIEVIIDRISEDENFEYEGRSYFDSPEIDGTVFIESGKAEIGEIVKVKLTDSWEYDLIGKIIQ